MKIKLWLRRLSISAPQMKVTAAKAWPTRILPALGLLAAGALVGIGVSEYGRPLAGLAKPVAAANGPTLELVELRSNLERLAANAHSAESQLNIERASQRELTAQIKRLEAENLRLTEDLAFFERLLPAGPRATGISIRGITAELISGSQLQYRLLVMQGGKHATDFQGTLRLTVGVIQNGRNVTLSFPTGKPAEINNFKLGFRHYQRLEGTLTLPPDVLPRSLQATVLERDQVRAQQTLNL